MYDDEWVEKLLQGFKEDIFSDDHDNLNEDADPDHIIELQNDQKYDVETEEDQEIDIEQIEKESILKNFMKKGTEMYKVGLSKVDEIDSEKEREDDYEADLD